MVLGFAFVGVFSVVKQRFSLLLAFLCLSTLTALGGGGPDTTGYLLPLIPILLILAAEAIRNLRLPVWPALVVWALSQPFFLHSQLMILDRSNDDSADSYQAALAKELDGRLLYTDNSPDFFLLLEHAFQARARPNVIYTPYLGLTWYRETLDPRLMTKISPKSDPSYGQIETAHKELGLTPPAYSFSSLPFGALGRLVPDGWVFHSGPFSPERERVAIEKWKCACPQGTLGARHRAIRLGQGGQLLSALGEQESALNRFGEALQYDPANTGLWLGLANSLAEKQNHEATLTAIASLFSLHPGDRRTALAAGSVLTKLSGTPSAPTAATYLCSLSASWPTVEALATKAARLTLSTGNSSNALRCLETYTGVLTAELLNLKAVALMLENKLQPAKAIFDRAIQLSVQDPEMRKGIAQNLAICLLRLNDPVAAESIIHRFDLQNSPPAR